MKRREAIQRMALASTGLLMPACQMNSETRGQTPNVVMIISDDQAWTDYTFMGHPVIQTPNIDRLARESLTFTNGYVPSSLCCPSLMTMITGLYPNQHGVTGNEPPRPDGVKWDDPDYIKRVQEMINYVDRVPTLPRMLAQENYQSLQTGKWWMGNYKRGGFSAGMTHGDPDRGGRHGDVGLDIGRKTMQPIYDFIDDCDQPFFLWYAPFLPHTPHNPPERLLDKYKNKTDSIYIARYWAMCEWFDQTCGELLGFLDERGLSENTLVVYVTDNGWIQQTDKNGYAPGSKRSQYDKGIRTPIMLRWPGKIKADKVSTTVSSIDLAPTILSACGLKPTPVMQGIDLLNQNAVQNRNAVFGDIYLHNAVNIHNPARNLTYLWCIADNRWKLILPHKENVLTRSREKGVGEPELYDLKSDPHEKENLASSNPAQVAELRRLIENWWPGKMPV